MRLQELYIKFKKNKISKAAFLYEVRRNPNLKNYINSLLSFNDTVKILKQKSLIFEVEFNNDLQQIAQNVISDLGNNYDENDIEISLATNYPELTDDEKKEIAAILLTSDDINEITEKPEEVMDFIIDYHPKYNCDGAEIGNLYTMSNAELEKTHKEALAAKNATGYNKGVSEGRTEEHVWDDVYQWLEIFSTDDNNFLRTNNIRSGIWLKRAVESGKVTPEQLDKIATNGEQVYSDLPLVKDLMEIKSSLNEAKKAAVKKTKLTVDQVNFYQYSLGIKYELQEKEDFSDEGLEKAKAKVLSNLQKDPTFYTNLLNQDKSPYAFKTPESQDKKFEKKIGPDGRMAIKGYSNAKDNVKDNLGKKEQGTKNPKGVKQMTMAPKKSKGVKVMEVPGKEKKIKLREVLRKMLQESLDEIGETPGVVNIPTNDPRKEDKIRKLKQNKQSYSVVTENDLEDILGNDKMGPESRKRYSLALDFYMYAEDDEQAKLKAQAFIEWFDKKVGGNAQITSLDSTPFASLQTKKIM
jgi:hypothetical protein